MLLLRIAAAVVESVDTGDLKSPGSDTVRVRVPSAAPRKGIPHGGIPFLNVDIGTRMINSQYAGVILLQPVQKLVATLIFARPPQGQKCKRVPSAAP